MPTIFVQHLHLHLTCEFDPLKAGFSLTLWHIVERNVNGCAICIPGFPRPRCGLEVIIQVAG